MRTSRFTLATGALALVVPLATSVAPAGAAPAATSKVVKVTVGLSPHAQILTTDCAGDFTTNDLQVHVHGPSKPPLGTGSLELQGGGLQYLVFAIGKPASAVTNEAISVHGSKVTGSISFNVELVMNNTASGADLLQETPATDGAWHRYSLTKDSLEEIHVDSNGAQTDIGPTTYATYAAAHASSTVSALELDVLGCIGSGPVVALDDLTGTVSGATTTYDFEPDTAVITPRAPATTPARTQTTVTGYLTRGGRAAQAAGIELEAKPKGSRTWFDAGTYATSWNGVVYSEQFLTEDTTFRWVSTGDADLGPTTSKTFTVHIKKPKKPAKKKH